MNGKCCQLNPDAVSRAFIKPAYQVGIKPTCARRSNAVCPPIAPKAPLIPLCPALLLGMPVASTALVSAPVTAEAFGLKEVTARKPQAVLGARTGVLGERSPPGLGSGSQFTPESAVEVSQPLPETLSMARRARCPAEAPGSHNPSRLLIRHVRSDPRRLRAIEGRDAFIIHFCHSRHVGLFAKFLHSFPCFICTDVFAKACHQLGEGAVEQKNKKNNKNDRTS